MNWYIVEAIVCVIGTAVFMVKFIKHNPKLFGLIDKAMSKTAAGVCETVGDIKDKISSK